MTTRDTARQFRELGYAVHPTVAGGKRPADAGWQKKRFSIEELERRYENNPALGVGVLLGAEGMLADADCDGEGAEEELRRLCGGTIPPTWCFDSERGPHYLLEGDPRLTGKRQSGKLELRFGPAMQTVLAPTGSRKWRLSPDDLPRPAKLPESVIAWALQEKPKPNVERPP